MSLLAGERCDGLPYMKGGLPVIKRIRTAAAYALGIYLATGWRSGWNPGEWPQREWGTAAVALAAVQAQLERQTKHRGSTAGVRAHEMAGRFGNGPPFLWPPLPEKEFFCIVNLRPVFGKGYVIENG